MALRPLHDRILVRRIEAEEKTAGGIIIPDTAKEKPQEGEVVAAGPGVRDEDGRRIPLDVNEAVVVGSFGKNTPLFNNASQDLNHTAFWKWMTPKGGGPIPGRLERQVEADFGSVKKMADDFVAAGVGQFGSGWCWLAVAGDKIAVMKTANGESHLVHGAMPILGCDVWEHSYYIDYRNRRPDYIKAFLEHLVNWEYVDELFQKAT